MEKKTGENGTGEIEEKIEIVHNENNSPLVTVEVNDDNLSCEKLENEKKPSEITESKITISPLCRADCKICNSEHIEEIHELLKLKKRYVDICEHLEKRFDFSISPASITRHYTNYKKSLKELAHKRMINSFEEEADELVRDQKRCSTLGTALYKNIVSRLEANTLEVSISDWEKIIKLRHNVLNGDNGAMDDLVGIFQKATDKYGAGLNQGMLFKK